MGFTATIDAVVALLTAGGVQAADDTADLNPPAVLVTPGALLPATKMCGTESMRMVLELVARDTGDRSALAALDDLYTQVKPIVSRIRTTEPSTFTRITGTNDTTGLPALRFTIETPITD